MRPNRERETLKKKKKGSGSAGRSKIGTSAFAVVEAIYVNPHPQSVVSNLDDSIPFLLLPVQIRNEVHDHARYGFVQGLP